MLNLGWDVKHWNFVLMENTEDGGGPASTTREYLLFLCDFIENVTAFVRVFDLGWIELDDEVAASFAKYSAALANQGLVVSVAKYLEGCGDSKECCKLQNWI